MEIKNFSDCLTQAGTLFTLKGTIFTLEGTLFTLKGTQNARTGTKSALLGTQQVRKYSLEEKRGEPFLILPSLNLFLGLEHNGLNPIHDLWVFLLYLLL